MAEQKSEENFVFLPWTVESQPQTQAVILENPQQQKIYVDLAHSTDWVVATSIMVSGLISLFGFLVTVYVVRKSTQQNIQINKELIDAQNNLKVEELKIYQLSKEKNQIREVASSLSLYGMTLCSVSNDLNQESKTKDISDQNDILDTYHNLQEAVSRLLVYLFPGKSEDEMIREELFELLGLASVVKNTSTSNNDLFRISTIEKFEEALGFTQASLNLFIEEKYKIYSRKAS